MLVEREQPKGQAAFYVCKKQGRPPTSAFLPWQPEVRFHQTVHGNAPITHHRQLPFSHESSYFLLFHHFIDILLSPPAEKRPKHVHARGNWEGARSCFYS